MIKTSGQTIRKKKDQKDNGKILKITQKMVWPIAGPQDMATIICTRGDRDGKA